MRPSGIFMRCDGDSLNSTIAKERKAEDASLLHVAHTSWERDGGSVFIVQSAAPSVGRVLAVAQIHGRR